MPRFVDAQAMHRKHPKTFEVPSAKVLSQLKPGDHVKVAAVEKTERGPSGMARERFWVLLTKVNGSKLEGTVDNDLVMVKLKYGAKVKFATKNVYATMPAKKSFLSKLLSNPAADGVLEWSRPQTVKIGHLLR